MARSDSGGEHRKRGQLSAAELAAAADVVDPSKAPRNTPVCGARKSKGGQRTGELCGHERGWGTNHPGYGRCKLHGGNTTAGKKFAAEQQARELVEQQRAKAVLFGRRTVIDPPDVLLEEMQRTHALVLNIEASMAAWLAEGVPAEKALTADGMGTADAISEEQKEAGLPQLIAVHSTEKAVGFTDTEFAAWAKVLREERRHLVQVAQACINVGVVERRQRMLEANAQFMRRVLEAAMLNMGLKVDAAVVAPAVQSAILSVVREVQGMAS